MITYHRKKIDKLLNKFKYYYQGVVLDIGGRDRGKFKKPKGKVEKWLFADIIADHKPDIIIDVANMNNIKSESIDVVNAIELFEHVEKINEGLQECYRILKKDGNMILSAPFLFPIHADPNDFQRWTEQKWKKSLTALGFTIENLVVMGRYFTVITDMIKTLINSLPKPFKWIKYLLFPIFDIIVLLDNTSYIKNHPRLGQYISGYFITVRKITN